MRVPILTTLAIAAALLLASPLSARGDSGTYVDDDRSRYEGFIEAAAREGLVNGCNPPDNDRFCPHRMVTRAEMAMLLSRVIDAPTPDSDVFGDDDGLTAELAINSLAGAGVTRGCRPEEFCPDRTLNRGEMAALIAGALDWKLRQVDPYRYTDLEGSPHARALVTLAERGALNACDPPEGRKLCPAAAVTRDEAVFAMMRALGRSPRAPSHDGANLDVGFYDGFSQLRLWDGRVPSSRNRVRLTENGVKGSGLKVDIPRGSHFGADFGLDLSDVVGDEPESLFFRYFIRLDPGWEPNVSGKLPGFSGIYGNTGKGGYRSSESSPGWSARIKFSGSRRDDPRAHLGYYVYHLGQERRYGDGMDWNEAGNLRPGEWYCVEGQVELNRPGLSDGALRAWVDGTPAFSEAGIAFRRPSEPEIKVESFWFNVYYGGKPVAPVDMGLTVDEVAVDGSRIGCGIGPGVSQRVEGDVSGDGYADRVWWEACDVTPCFRMRRTDTQGVPPAQDLGSGAWFSLETHRLGLHTLDVDGDGDDDILYRGRCGPSKRCWRIHRSEEGSTGPGQDWGDGARFSAATRSLITGDWDGDGREDVTYRGRCGSEVHHCWRVHLSRKGTFAPPADWGAPPEQFDSSPEAADMDGDGADDLLYAAPCGDRRCWFVQTSTGKGFRPPRRIGVARPAELEWRRLFDLDGDDRADLITIRQDGGSTAEVRYHTGRGWSRPVPILETDRELSDLQLRSARRRVEAVAIRSCRDAGGCPLPLLERSGTLMTGRQFIRDVTHDLVPELEWKTSPLVLYHP
ncbi:MAG: S-layer homology domain-containing protein [Actinomycetota bacterium]